MRLDKLLANEGFGSRKEVKKLIKNGSVEVNGEKAKDVSTHVDPYESEVIVNGELIDYREFIYIMLNKPKGIVSATHDAKDRCVTDLLDPYYHKFHLFPVGRLDKDTEGLILLTNDGELAHQLTSPKKKVDKVYEATIKGRVSDHEVQAFENGVTLDDGYETKPASLYIEKVAGDFSWVQITIQEGKFHQIKRMFKAVNKEVRYLKRLKIGTLELDEALELGEYRELLDEELALLKE
ncbi:pseudouridine synthase [Alkalibacillus aidingensis]|uniref:pseudouridine synthase n=1 Tax=Alkalibacillus aidingensis TaxID=2747607 RepID=UPI0016612740|nr:pseudouridine synthase [Alkalibacillus aidingensis]